MNQTYEERFGSIERRVRHVCRAVRWRSLPLLGRRRHMLAEIRWRLGDEVMALPVYEAIKARYSDVRLAVWCNYPDLLIDNPFVDEVNGAAGPVDGYCLLRGAARTVFRLEQYARNAGVPMPATRPLLHYRDWRAPQLDALPRERPLVAVCTGATWPTKRWRLASWRALCRRLIENGCGLVQVGHGEDGRVGIGECLVGQTTVREAACVLHASNLLITGDSGLMHLARAAGTPVVALFGPTDPAILIRDDPGLVALVNGRPCQGCWNTASPRPDAPRMAQEGICPLGVSDCLETIPVESVADAAFQMLAAPPRRQRDPFRRDESEF